MGERLGVVLICYFHQINPLAPLFVGFLGSGQKACPEEAFPFCKLAYFLLKVLNGVLLNCSLLSLTHCIECLSSHASLPLKDFCFSLALIVSKLIYYAVLLLGSRHWSLSMSNLIQILLISGQRHVKFYSEKMI